jgi:hypothetical protein
MSRPNRSKHFSFDAINDPLIVEWAETVESPIWKGLMVNYVSVGSSKSNFTLIDEFITHLDMPRRDYSEVGRQQGIALLRDYLAFDPVYNQPRSTPAETEACAHRFVGLFSASAKFFADDDVAAGGIKTALAEWGMSLIGIDQSRIGGLWLADED